MPVQRFDSSVYVSWKYKYLETWALPRHRSLYSYYRLLYSIYYGTSISLFFIAKMLASSSFTWELAINMDWPTADRSEYLPPKIDLKRTGSEPHDSDCPKK